MSDIFGKIGKVIKGAKVIAPKKVDDILDVADKGIDTAEAVKEALPKGKVRGKADAKIGVKDK